VFDPGSPKIWAEATPMPGHTARTTMSQSRKLRETVPNINNPDRSLREKPVCNELVNAAQQQTLLLSRLIHMRPAIALFPGTARDFPRDWQIALSARRREKNTRERTRPPILSSVDGQLVRQQNSLKDQ